MVDFIIIFSVFVFIKIFIFDKNIFVEYLDIIVFYIDFFNFLDIMDVFL